MEMATWIKMKEVGFVWYKARRNNFGTSLEETTLWIVDD
jgi:hypothetical protein